MTSVLPMTGMNGRVLSVLSRFCSMRSDDGHRTFEGDWFSQRSDGSCAVAGEGWSVLMRLFAFVRSSRGTIGVIGAALENEMGR